MTHSEILKSIYNKALEDEPNIQLAKEISDKINMLASYSESHKGLLTVLITLLTHKIFDASQDIRFHQAQLPNGFSGRSIDKNFITPFMKSVNFPAMAESGWLTRTLEQPHPYTLDYPGKIKPDNLKNAFLEIIDEVQEHEAAPDKILYYIFKLLIKQRDDINIELAKPHSLSISNIVTLLKKHFTFKYSCPGASRLPTLAVYAAYQCMMSQVARYNDKVLCQLEAHNSADAQSGRIGDIQVSNQNGSAFEGVEIKHEITVTKQLITDAYEKFKIYNTDRYYLLTTANMDEADLENIENEIRRIRQIHGCQVIVNGVYSTLKYYLRLMKDTADFIDRYVELLKIDDTVKFQHKTVWNDLVSQGIF